jgi:hypothetical protein
MRSYSIDERYHPLSSLSNALCIRTVVSQLAKAITSSLHQSWDPLPAMMLLLPLQLSI